MAPLLPVNTLLDALAQVGQQVPVEARIAVDDLLDSWRPYLYRARPDRG